MGPLTRPLNSTSADTIMAEEKRSKDTSGRKPRGLRWRSSLAFVTFVVMLGILTDLLVYSLIIPVIPYQLEALGYDAIGSKISWLLVAFSGALVLSTPPIAHFSEVYRNRKIPLLAGLIALIGSQIMFMEAPVYWLMILARLLQGVSSTVIWTVGLALLCDTAPEEHLGRQFGIVSMGLTIGLLVGPPVAGILYQRLGYRAPFVFGIIVTCIDLLARLLLVERHEAMRWGVDPMAIAAGSKEDLEPGVTGAERAEHPSVLEPRPDEGEGGTKVEVEEKAKERDQAEKQLQEPKQPQTTLLPHVALFRLMRSPRAAVCIILTLIWGLGWAGQESVVVLHMNNVWGLDPHQAGTAFIAAVVPTIFSGILSGWLSDKYGPALIGCAALLLSLPWYGLITINGSLAIFLVFFALEVFFASGLIPPTMLELSSASRTIEGIGYAHVYGVFNLAYGIGTTVGPIMAGQMYDNIRRGWLAIAFMVLGFTFVGFILALFMLGERPLALQLFKRKTQAP